MSHTPEKKRKRECNPGSRPERAHPHTWIPARTSTHTHVTIDIDRTKKDLEDFDLLRQQGRRILLKVVQTEVGGVVSSREYTYKYLFPDGRETYAFVSDRFSRQAASVEPTEEDWKRLKTSEGELLSPEEEEVEGQRFIFERHKYTLGDGREVIYSVGEPKEWWEKEKQAAAKGAPSKKELDWGQEDPVWREAMAVAPENWSEELKAKILALKPGSTLEEIAGGIRKHQQAGTPPDRDPEGFALRSSAPNPFNPQTTIRYELPEASDVQIVIYNLTGQKVRTLLAGQMAAGSHQVVWDGRNGAGLQVASGTYLVDMKAGNFQQTLKVTLAK